MKIIECSSCHVNLEIEDDYYEELVSQGIICPECSSVILIPNGDDHKEPNILAKEFRSSRTKIKAWLLAVLILTLLFTGIYLFFHNKKQHPDEVAFDVTEDANFQVSETSDGVISENSAVTVATFTFTIPSTLDPARISGSINIIHQGHQISLKQVPIFIFYINEEFASTYNELSDQAVPLLEEIAHSEGNSQKTVRALQELIDVEKKRVLFFQRKITSTVLSDNNGMFSFNDLAPGNYLVFIEGTIGDRVLIWSDLIDLKEGDSIILKFDESNVGATEQIYVFSNAWAHARREDSIVGGSNNGDVLFEKGLTALDNGDNDLAVQFFLASAEAGNASSQYNMGIAYVDGIGVQSDNDRAFYWYRKAAQQGHDDAQLKLGLFYYRGVSVAKDIEKAIYWFRQSSDQGNTDAKHALNDLLLEDSITRGVNKNPPDKDASEHYLTRGADILVQDKINSGELINARKVGFQFQYVYNHEYVGAKAQVDYEFTFRTRTGTIRRNIGYLYFYYNKNKREWFNSDTNIDGLPRY